MITDYYASNDSVNPVSDNFVAGDNIFLGQLHNFFFECLGMMSITHYGAIGDGRRDNYGPLQVAIDDAKRRGLVYLYVPFGRYIYTGELLDLDKVTFVGNPHARIINIRTKEEIPIKQFGAMWGDMTNYYTKDEVDSLLATAMSGYYTKDEIDAMLEFKQNRLIAGEGITIDNDVISATNDIEGTPFDSCPSPTTWSGTTTELTGTNDYGTWAISTTVTPRPDTGTSLEYAFDGDDETFFYPRRGQTYYGDIQIDMPTGVSIRPTQFHFLWDTSTGIYDPANSRIIYGYNPDTSAWERIGQVIKQDDYQNDFTVNINTNTYYTKFKLTTVGTLTNTNDGMYEFEIKKGYIKDENGGGGE